VYVVSPLPARHAGAADDVVVDAPPPTKRRRRRRSCESPDENHNEQRRRCATSTSSRSSRSSSCGDDVEATDLSVARRPRTRTPSTSSSVQSDDRSAASAPPLHPALQASAGASPLSYVQQALQQQMQLAMRYMHHQPLYPQPTQQRWMPWSIHPAKPEPPPPPPPTDLDDAAAEVAVGVGGEVLLRRKRSRVFIDPLSEIPRLERWFAVDSHPSSAAIDRLTAELNRSAYRQRFPPLEPKNVQLWFKNHRAKVKRQSVESLALTSQLMSGTGDVGDDVRLQVPAAATTPLPGNRYPGDVVVMVRDETVT